MTKLVKINMLESNMLNPLAVFKRFLAQRPKPAHDLSEPAQETQAEANIRAFGMSTDSHTSTDDNLSEVQIGRRLDEIAHDNGSGTHGPTLVDEINQEWEKTHPDGENSTPR